MSAVTDAAALLTTLADYDKEFPGQPAIASHVYLAMDLDMERYERVVAVLASQGWVEATAEQLSITESGKEKAKEVEAILEKGAEE